MTHPRPYSRPLPPALAPAERMARHQRDKEKREAKKQERAEQRQLAKYDGLRFDYGQIDEAQREHVREAALEIHKRLKRTVEDMIEIGKQLEWAKSVLAHGQFTEWAQMEFGMSRGSIEEYRYIAARFDGKRSIIDHLAPTIVRRLAAPSVPDEAINAVIAAAQASDKPLRVQDALDVAKPFLPAKPPKAKQLPPPQEIEAEYTVAPVGIIPGMDSGKVMLTLDRELAAKLQDALVHRILKSLLTPAEHDQLLIALSRALKTEALR